MPELIFILAGGTLRSLGGKWRLRGAIASSNYVLGVGKEIPLWRGKKPTAGCQNSPGNNLEKSSEEGEKGGGEGGGGKMLGGGGVPTLLAMLE